MLTTIALVTVAILAAILLAAYVRPSSFTVTRETEIAATPVRIHPLISDFKAWQGWSPWEGRDPAMKRSYEGAAKGVGAAYGWEGNKAVGRGRMEISASMPERIDIDLHFMKPFEARNKTVFSLTPSGKATRVQWQMTGASPFMMRLIGLFMSMDAMVGKDFEQGLAQLKQRAENP